jgi:hypothetical protein
VTVERLLDKELLWRGLLAADGAVKRVDDVLKLNEFGSRPLRLLAIEWRGKDLGVRVAVLEHAAARFPQQFQSVAHLCLAPAFVGTHTGGSNGSNQFSMACTKAAMSIVAKLENVSDTA